ncbi:MAG: DUF4139 domain-containing protein [Fluviicola sp.]|nr:DUF4139 domain-containing protein [Fluviicola sp.]MBP6272391.1 DUF4139 domain-containing protein [Fluviicola sp.]
MKRSISLMLLLFIAQSLLATEKETIKSTLSEVTVYTNGAQIHRKANFTVKPGITELIIEGVSPNIDPKSLQVKAFGNVVLIDSKYDTYYPKPVKVELNGLPLKIRNDISQLKDSMDQVSYDVKEIQDEIDVLTMTKNILSNNGAVRGQGKVNDSIQLLKQTLDYYQVKMNELNKKIQVLTTRKKAKDARLSKMNIRLQELMNYQSSNTPIENKGPIHRLLITLQAKEAVTGKLAISYLASGASWVPTYDLRADIETGKVNLTYKATISQSTGEKWDDVRLTLSTNDPYQNKTKPELHPWYVDYMNLYGNMNGRLNSVSIAEKPAVAYFKDNRDDEKKEADTQEVYIANGQQSYEFTTMIERVLSAEYKIDLPYTIEADGQEHMVLVRNIDLAASYNYYTVPKLDPGVYLMAEIIKLDELQLVPAQATIFFDGTYIGETYLDPSSTSDTLRLSLGKDPNILVKRILLKKDSKDQTIGSDRERTFSYEISMKNLKGTKIQLIVEDQIPLTTNGAIKIEDTETGKANYDKSTGMLKWKINLDPKEAKKVTYGFKIKHPKEQNVQVN